MSAAKLFLSFSPILKTIRRPVIVEIKACRPHSLIMAYNDRICNGYFYNSGNALSLQVYDIKFNCGTLGQYLNP
jgi:hypothetical protein